MKKKKTISFILLLLSFTIVIADYSVFVFSDSAVTKAYSTCPNISDHFEHSHSYGTDDPLMMNETKSETTYICFPDYFIPSTAFRFCSKYISKIWQPPRF